MPFSYTIDKKLGLVQTKAWGTITVDEWLAYDKELEADSDFQPTFNQLADFTQVSEAAIPSDRIAEIAAAAPFAKASRRAGVASKHYIFGMGRVYQAHSASDVEFRIFRTVREAREWLGI